MPAAMAAPCPSEPVLASTPRRFLHSVCPCMMKPYWRSVAKCSVRNSRASQGTRRGRGTMSLGEEKRPAAATVGAGDDAQHGK
jgi:hypothetical protein